MNTSAVRIVTNGTPATASPIPAKTVWRMAVTMTPSATARIARTARCTAFSPRDPARRRAKRSTPSATISAFEYRIATMTTVSRNWTSSKPRPPTWPTNQSASPRAKGDRRADTSSGLAAANCRQRCASREPITGRAATHPGGCGRVSVSSDFDQSAICLAFYTTVAVEDGRTFFFDDIYGYDTLLAFALEKRYAGCTADGRARTHGMADSGGGGPPMPGPVPGERAIATSPRPERRTVRFPGGARAVAQGRSPRGRPEGL